MVEGSNTGKMKLKVVVRQGDQRMVQQLAQFSLRCPKLATAVFEKIATFFKYCQSGYTAVNGQIVWE